MKRLFVSVALAGWLSQPLFAQEELAREPVPVAAAAAPRIDDGAEPLTRGPVHEAFAQAVTPAAEAGLIVTKEPPPLIDEIAPAQRPAGDDIAWIPGYWGWDDDRKDFIWISGIWRALPPGREWVPGYWAKVTDGYQWISGYWADQRIEEIEYLPAPPETVDAGPSTPSPTGNEIWIPGTWMWQQNKYVWRAGYWANGNQRWIWTNAHYVYTPRGYLYVSGYWDFLVPQRGVLFSPVYFNNPVPQNYVYSPRVVVNTLTLADHLFLRPTYRHYYFGDYYAANYRGRGILPYFVFHNSRYGFDSLYSFNRWAHRNDQNWERRVESRYEDLREREAGRPPRDISSWNNRRDRDNDKNPFVFNSMQDFGKFKGHDLKFSDFDDTARRTAGNLSRDLDAYRQNRLRTESERTARTGDDRGSDRVRLLKPPINEENVQPGVDRNPGRDDERPRLERTPSPRIDSKGPAGARESDGTLPPRTAPREQRDIQGSLNDIRTPPPANHREPLEHPVPNRDRPGPLNDLRDQPRDLPKGRDRNDPDNDRRRGVTSPRTLPGSDNELPNRPAPRGDGAVTSPRTLPSGGGKGEVPRGSVREQDPVVRPPVTSPRTLPTPKAEAPKNAPPRETPRANPAPASRTPANPSPKAGGNEKGKNEREKRNGKRE